MFLLKWGRRSETPDPAANAWSSAAMDPIEVYTADTRVSGWLTSGGQRLTDLLNQATEVRIWRPAARPLFAEADGASPAAAPDGEWYNLATDDILVAMPPDRVSHRQVRVHRQLQLTRLEIGPFQITGGLHVPPGAPVEAYLMRYQHRFVPLTDATVAHMGQVESEQSVDVAIVNIRQVLSIQAG